MDNQMLVTIGVAVVAVVLLAAWLLMRRRRTSLLRSRFGPEYDSVVRSTGTSAKAEEALEARQRRVEAFALRPLSREDAEEFARSWKSVQARFVDDPQGAVIDADRLIGDVMRARGYPVESPDRRLEDLSVEHAHVVNHYRSGRDIVVRHEQGAGTTEDLRQAMVHFRALFDELADATRPSVRRAS